jgi:hypothetical protein
VRISSTRRTGNDAAFKPERFERGDAVKSFDGFAEEGRVYYKKAGLFKRDLTGREAESRLGSYYDPKSVYVELKDGTVHKISSFGALQTLDTFQGLGLKPVDSPQVVDAVKTLDKGVDNNDGLYRDGFLLTPEKRLNGFEAYNALTVRGEQAGRAALKGAAIGAGATLGLGLVAAGAGALFPSIVPSALSGVSAVLAAGGAGIAAGAVLGSGVGFIGYKNAHPKELEVRHGEDSGLKIQSKDHAVEVHHWLEDRAANPFTQEQQHQALNYLAEHTGLYKRSKKISADAALSRLKEGKAVRVKSRIPDRYDTMTSVRHLQQMDTVRGLGVNPVLPKEVGDSLRFLESGKTDGDGLYKKGRFEPKGRLSAFEAVDYLFREREPIGVTVQEKNYQTKTLKNIQELNALKGDGENTILPEGPFQALLFFDQRELMKGAEDVALDSYEALQEMNEERPVTVASDGRNATTLKPADLHELRSLEFDKTNSILPQRDFDLLQYWQGQSQYRVGGETEGQKAYEALQSLQAGKEFEIQSADRFAPALTFQDLEDLCSFEKPDSGFKNNVPPEDQDRLTYFQDRHEADGRRAVRVGEREGRAYEGYRELRDGKPFNVRAGAVWNKVTSSQALHDLDALLGRGVNDILPQKQYDLIKHLGDDSSTEGLAKDGTKLNSYAALQVFRGGEPVTYDFNGGDFGELLKIPTADLEALDQTKLLRDNQKEYDKYSYPVPEWQDKMERRLALTPDLGRQNVQHGESNLARGRSDLSDAESDLRSAKSDLSRARSDLSYAESELSRARSMPRYNTKYRRVCDSNNNCRQESYQEHNWDRDRAISRANSLVSDAESKIRRAKSDIRKAESLIDEANRDIRRAKGEIADAERLLSLLPSLSKAVSGVTSENYSTVVKTIETTLQQMKPLSHISGLDRNLRRQTQLIGNMATRPGRPAGWVVPEPLVQS